MGPSEDPNARRTMPVAPITRALPAMRTSVPSAGSPGLAYGSSLRAVAQALDPDLASVVAAVPAWSGLEPKVASLGGGITNRNFRVDIAGQSFVVRLFGKDSELLGIDRAAEHQAATSAAKAGVAPEAEEHGVRVPDEYGSGPAQFKLNVKSHLPTSSVPTKQWRPKLPEAPEYVPVPPVTTPTLSFVS